MYRDPLAGPIAFYSINYQYAYLATNYRRGYAIPPSRTIRHIQVPVITQHSYTRTQQLHTGTIAHIYTDYMVELRTS